MGSPGNSDRERHEEIRKRQPRDHRGTSSMRIDVYHHFPRDPDRENFEQKILGILQQQEHHMTKLDDQLDAMVASAEAEDTKIDSIIALLGQITKPLDLTPEQQAKLDKITAAIGDNADRIQAAIDANTPPPAPQT